jgi:DNA-binding MarR family transcriptional regulator
MNAVLDPTPDLESRAADSDHQALRVWLRLLACTNRIETAVRNRLRSEFGTTLPRFDLLAQLERCPDGLTMGELSPRMMVTGGNVTGVTDQLEAEGLVARGAHPSDRRAWVVKLTPSGRRQFRRMAATHEGWIAELLAGWSSDDLQRVQALLGKLKSHLTTPAAAEPVPRRKASSNDKGRAA